MKRSEPQHQTTTGEKQCKLQRTAHLCETIYIAWVRCVTLRDDTPDAGRKFGP